MAEKHTKSVGFPKNIVVRGIEIVVNDWDEMEEVVRRFGSESGTRAATPAGDPPHRAPRNPAGGDAILDHTDRMLLQQFVEAGSRGILSTQITQVLGKRGRGIPTALEEWSRRIGLVTQDGASAFQATKRHEGRGFRMTDLHLKSARSMLGSS